MPSVPPEAEPFEVYLLSKFDVSSFFKLIILITLSSSKLIVKLLTLGKLKLTLIYFYLLWAGHSCFTEIGQDVKPRKTIQTLSVWQKIKRTRHRRIWNTISMIQSARIKNWVPQLINRLRRFSLLFLSAKRFSDLLTKQNMHDKNNYRKF